MNIDANVQRIIFAILRKWKMIVIFLVVGALLGYFYTLNFTIPTYTAEVKFLTYAVDSQEDINLYYGDDIRTSNTSKMNYAMKMLDTYLEIMETTKFSGTVADDLNKRISSNYSAGDIKSAMTFNAIENTAMFTVVVSSSDANFTYEVAKQLEKTVPKTLKKTNNGLVQASVEDSAVRPTSAANPGYIKKSLFSALCAFILAVAIIIIKNFLDVRIKDADELTERYEIPVLGNIPDFNSKTASVKAEEKVYVKK